MKVLNEYPNSHHYWRSYEKSDLYCPFCGKKELWREQGSGDYYVGNASVCTECGGTSNLDYCSAGSNYGANYAGVLEQLRSGITKKPTTKKGT